MSRIENVTEYIIKELKKHNIIIHRYDAYSTNSIYLKLDYGACNSIRISDHTGKEHLKYKYNVMPKCKNGWVRDKQFWRYYCNISQDKFIDDMIKIITDDRLAKIILVGKENYNKKVSQLCDESSNAIGFWEKCFEVYYMEIATIQKQIRDKSVDNFYIFTGDETAVQKIYVDKIAECKGLNIIRADSVSDIMVKLHNRTFICNNNCYVIRNDSDFLKAETSWDKVISSIGNNIFILIYDNIDKRGKFYKRFTDTIAIFEHLGEDILTKYIQKHINLSVDNCKILIDVCENDYSRILLEIDKIQQYLLTIQNSSVDSVFEKLLNDGTIYRPPKDAIFDMVDSVCKGRIIDTYRLYSDYKGVNENPLAIITVLYNNMKQLLQVQSCKDTDIAKTTGLNSWIIQQTKQKIGAYTISELVNALRLIQATETKIKTGEMEQDIVIDYILLNVLRG